MGSWMKQSIRNNCAVDGLGCSLAHVLSYSDDSGTGISKGHYAECVSCTVGVS